MPRWGVLALLINLAFLDRILWGGVIVAPLIGLLMGLIARPVHHWPVALRVIVAIFSLFVAAGLFGAAAGLTAPSDAYSLGESLLGVAMSVMVGIIIFPLWVVLIPAAVINHYLLGRLVVDTSSNIGATA